MPVEKNDILARLRREILPLEGYQPAPPEGKEPDYGLGPVAAAFPQGVFATGAMHEFLHDGPENAAATAGFVAALAGKLMDAGGALLWIGARRALFPPGLTRFGIEPHRIVFVDAAREKDLWWATEEALKCEGLAAVVTELRDIPFATSRRLQLAVEQSRVTGFLVRPESRLARSVAAVARWKISVAPGQTPDGLPGLGFPRWSVELQKVRNGRPGAWTLEWADRRFRYVEPEVADIPNKQRRAG